MKLDRLAVLGAAAALVFASVSDTGATVLPLGFVETSVVDDLVSPTAMVVAPDGRIFVAEQDGRVRIVKNAALLDEPFVQLTVDNIYERGLLGIALDPGFASNNYVYVYYSVAATRTNRLVRLTAEGDHALPGSEKLLLELPPYGVNARYHFGGALHFGPDGKLYIGVGDHSASSNAQSKNNPFGKILRINADGTIPTSNPFYGSTTGVNRAIWVYGVRNPFTTAFDPDSGRMFINDVGAADWEEINEGEAGANYGWPLAEGFSDNPAFTDPVYAYPHGAGNPVFGCAITAGVFYAPAVAQFPVTYEGGYFFADFCGRWIRWLNPQTDQPLDFVRQLPGNPTDLDLAADGSLYVMVRPAGGVRQDDPGAIYRIFYTGSLAPQITVQPESQTVLYGDPATFAVEALGADSFRWQRDGEDIPGATSASYTIAAVTEQDDGAEIRVIVHNEFGDTTSQTAVLTGTDNELPVPSIVVQKPHDLYRGGDEVTFSGSAVDPEDGTIGAASFVWRVDFHHNTHFHPYLPPTPGVAGGDFTVATVGETATDVWYRVNLRVTDSGGRSATAYVDVFPEIATFTVDTSPDGLEVLVDGRPFPGGVELDGVVGMSRAIAVEPEQTLLEEGFVFDHWSDGLGVEHDITVQPGSTTYTAFFVSTETTTTTLPVPGCGNGVIDEGEDCDDGDEAFEHGELCRADCMRVPCGKPTNSAGARPLGSDALFTLRAAVGQASCVVQVCDVDDSGDIVATDALSVLRAAVGLAVGLACPEL